MCKIFLLFLLLQKLEISTLEFSNQKFLVIDPDFAVKKDFSSQSVAVLRNISQLNPSKSRGSRMQHNLFLEMSTLDLLYETLQHINTLNKQCEVHCWTPKIFLKLKLINTTIDAVLVDISTKLSELRLTAIDLRSNVYLIMQTHEVFEIFMVKNELRIQSVSVKFQENQELSLEFLETNIHRRKNFRGIIVNGVTQDAEELDLLAKFKRDNQGRLQFSDGISVTYFRLMSIGLNFSEGAINGTGWINQAENGTLLGMAEQLKSGEADVLIANSELLPYRLHGLRFLQPYYRGKIRAFFKQPPQNQIRNIFFHPLQPELWISLGILWILIVLSLLTVNKFRHIYFSPTKTCELKPTKDERMFKYGDNEGSNDDIFANDALLWAVGSACGQGWHMLPQTGTMKLIMLSGLITFIFTYTAYSAAIVTSLSIFLIPIKSWADLLNTSYTIYGDTLLQSSRSITNASSFGRVNALVPSKQTTIGVIEALKLMSQNKPVAIISVFDQFYQIASKSKEFSKDDFLCKTVSVVNVNVSAVQGGMIVNENSPFKKFFNYQTIMIQERGLDSRISIQYSSKLSPGCLVKTPFSLNSYTLEINDVFTAFAILLCGFLLSILAILLERITQSKPTSEEIVTTLVRKIAILSLQVRNYFPMHFFSNNLEKVCNFLKANFNLDVN